MRRTLAIALAAGVLLLGGCAKQQDPAVPVPAAVYPAASSSADGVDGLLDQVDQQLSSDGQPAADQD